MARVQQLRELFGEHADSEMGDALGGTILTMQFHLADGMIAKAIAARGGLA